MWTVWEPKYQWGFLCPIKFADPIGLLVVMPRAHQPVTPAEIDAVWPDRYPGVNCETKPDDFGRLDGRVYCLDYGLPDADMISDERRSYRSKAP